MSSPPPPDIKNLSPAPPPSNFFQLKSTSDPIDFWKFVATDLNSNSSLASKKKFKTAHRSRKTVSKRRNKLDRFPVEIFFSVEDHSYYPDFYLN